MRGAVAVFRWRVGRESALLSHRSSIAMLASGPLSAQEPLNGESDFKRVKWFCYKVSCACSQDLVNQPLAFHAGDHDHLAIRADRSDSLQRFEPALFRHHQIQENDFRVLRRGQSTGFFAVGRFAEVESCPSE